jgi:hypothetical protein
MTFGGRAEPPLIVPARRLRPARFPLRPGSSRAGTEHVFAHPVWELAEQCAWGPHSVWKQASQCSGGAHSPPKSRRVENIALHCGRTRCPKFDMRRCGENFPRCRENQGKNAGEIKYMNERLPSKLFAAWDLRSAGARTSGDAPRGDRFFCKINKVRTGPGAPRDLPKPARSLG